MTRRRTDNKTIELLFEVPEPAPRIAGTMNYGKAIAHLVSEVLRDADGDRYEVAARMSRLSGKDVTKYMLDAWSAEARENYNIPSYMIPVLEEACDSLHITNYLVSLRGGRAYYGKETLEARLGKLELQKQDVTKKIRELRQVMGDEQ